MSPPSPKFLERPFVFQAEQFDPHAAEETSMRRLAIFVGRPVVKTVGTFRGDDKYTIVLKPDTAPVELRPRDWIVRTPKGFEKVPQEAFIRKFTPAPEDESEDNPPYIMQHTKPVDTDTAGA